MMLTLGITALSVCVSAALLRRKPIIITLNAHAQVMETASTPSLEDGAEQAARKYLALRYGWAPETLGANLARAKAFIASQSLNAFQKTMGELQTFSKGKNITQRVYPTSIQVDAKKSQVRITADRFTEIQGLKAATLLRVTLTYQTGPASVENPWGIYVVKEDENQ